MKPGGKARDLSASLIIQNYVFSLEYNEISCLWIIIYACVYVKIILINTDLFAKRLTLTTGFARDKTYK